MAARDRRLRTNVGVTKIEAKELKKFIKRLPPDIKKNVSRLARRKADEMVAGMKAIVPVDKGVLKRSIHARPYAHGMKFYIAAGIRKRGAVGKYVEFGTRKMEKQPYFLPIVKLVGEKFSRAVARSLTRQINKGIKEGRIKPR